MSVRGITSLNGIGLGRHIAEEYGIPMYARMIHNLDGSTYPIPYGKDNQCIYSVGRRYINEILLTGELQTGSLEFRIFLLDMFVFLLIRPQLEKSIQTCTTTSNTNLWT